MNQNSTEALFKLIVRLFLLFFILVFFVPMLSALPGPLEAIRMPGNEGYYFLVYFSLCLVMGALILLLWKRPQFLLPEIKGEELNVSVPAIETIAYTVVGLWFTIAGISRLFFVSWTTAVPDGDMKFSYASVSTTAAIQLICGIWLVLGADGLRRILAHLRGPRLG